MKQLLTELRDLLGKHNAEIDIFVNERRSASVFSYPYFDDEEDDAGRIERLIAGKKPKIVIREHAKHNVLATIGCDFNEGYLDYSVIDSMIREEEGRI